MSEPERRPAWGTRIFLWCLELGVQVAFIIFFYVLISVHQLQLLGR